MSVVWPQLIYVIIERIFLSVNILAIRQLSVNPIQTVWKQIHPEVMHAEEHFS